MAFTAGRDGTLLANPYTGTVAAQGGERLRSFFDAVTGWHRWFNASGENRAAARAITGASNLAFLFLVLSGIYLWLPRIWKWAAFKTRILFNPKASSSKARDFNWHHVFGIWSAIPLAVIVASAVVFSYPWANNLVYRSVGEEPPVRGAPRGGPGGPAAPAREGADGNRTSGSDWGSLGESVSYDQLFARAATEAGDWRTLTLNLPADASAATVRFGVDRGNGGQPQLRHNLTLDAATRRRAGVATVLESIDRAESPLVDPLPSHRRSARHRRPNDRRHRFAHERVDGVDGSRARLPAPAGAVVRAPRRYAERLSCLTVSP